MKRLLPFKLIAVQAAVLFFLLPKILFAHPPTGLKLEYDKKKSLLHIEMTHVTANIVKHYIRRIVIYKNGTQEKAWAIVKQTTPHNHAEDVSLKAVAGDMISVEAYSTEGGIGKATLVVPKDPDPQTKKVGK